MAAHPLGALGLAVAQIASTKVRWVIRLKRERDSLGAFIHVIPRPAVCHFSATNEIIPQ